MNTLDGIAAAQVARCPKCGRPWRPCVINLVDIPLYCVVTDDLGCVEGQREIFRHAMIDIANESGGHGLEDSALGRINRIAHDALGNRSIEVAEAMMKRKAVPA